MTDVGWVIPKGAKRKNPASRSSRLPKTLGESKLGTQSQSIAPSGATRAPVWQSERNAYSAIGGNGEGAAALCGRGLVVGSTAVMSSPTGRASGRGRTGACRPPRGPKSPAYRGGREA